MKTNLTKTEQLRRLKARRVKCYNEYVRECKDGDPDEAWSRVENIDSEIITLIMSSEWTEQE